MNMKADVNFVKEFANSLHLKAVGQEVLKFNFRTVY